MNPKNHDPIQNDFVPLNETVKQVTERIIARSHVTRRAYLKKSKPQKAKLYIVLNWLVVIWLMVSLLVRPTTKIA